MSTIYGPVSSWRFGLSLGIDPVPPPKRCTFNCVYCQLGPTRRLIRNPLAIQEDLPSVDHVLQDLDEHLEQVNIQSIDVATFSGSGEPTLNFRLGELARQLRSRLEHIPLIILTNGSLLDYPQVQENLAKLDMITIKFDAGDDSTLRAINRPAIPFTPAKLITGIQQLRKNTHNIIALEVMLLEMTTGESNVVGEPRDQLLEAIIKAAPDLVQIYTPWRPPADTKVRPVDRQALESFAHQLSNTIGTAKLWIYGIHDARKKSDRWHSYQAFSQELLAILQRRPCRLTDLVNTFNLPAPKVLHHITQFLRKGAIVSRRHLNETYYLVNTKS